MSTKIGRIVRKRKTAFIALVLVVAGGLCLAKQPESYYQRKWCGAQHGRTEVRLPDRTRVDCILDSHAVEVDFARKWAEAIGQSLHYSRMTGRRAGILLIMLSPKDQRHLDRLLNVVQHFDLPIDVFTIE